MGTHYTSFSISFILHGRHCVCVRYLSIASAFVAALQTYFLISSASVCSYSLWLDIGFFASFFAVCFSSVPFCRLKRHGIYLSISRAACVSIISQTECLFMCVWAHTHVFRQTAWRTWERDMILPPRRHSVYMNALDIHRMWHSVRVSHTNTCMQKSKNWRCVVDISYAKDRRCKKTSGTSMYMYANNIHDCWLFIIFHSHGISLCAR